MFLFTVKKNDRDIGDGLLHSTHAGAAEDFLLVGLHVRPEGQPGGQDCSQGASEDLAPLPVQSCGRHHVRSHLW